MLDFLGSPPICEEARFPWLQDHYPSFLIPMHLASTFPLSRVFFSLTLGPCVQVSLYPGKKKFAQSCIFFLLYLSLKQFLIFWNQVLFPPFYILFCWSLRNSILTIGWFFISLQPNWLHIQWTFSPLLASMALAVLQPSTSLRWLFPPPPTWQQAKFWPVVALYLHSVQLEAHPFCNYYFRDESPQNLWSHLFDKVR